MTKWPKWNPAQANYNVDTVIISDLHLGSAVSRVDALARALTEFMFRRLILLGDIFDDLDFNRLSESEWEFLGWVRKLTNRKRGKEVIWIIGNHDKNIAGVFRHFVGLPVHREYTWKHHGRQYLATHGDQFDRFMINNPVISELASGIYYYIQKYGGKSQKVSRWLKRQSKYWLHLHDKIAHDAAEHAHDRGAQVIFCGHTHLAMDNNNNSVRYVNAGCWTDNPSTLVSVGHHGEIKIHEFH